MTKRVSSGDVTASGDITARDVITGIQVRHIVNVYRSGGGGLTEEEYRRALGSYLRWLARSTGKVVLRGIKRGGQQVLELPLQDVYVPLAAEPLPEMRELLKAERSGTALATGEPRKSPQITMGELLAQGSRLALVGGPGCGKTTVLQHIAWTLAEALSSGNAQLAADRLGLTEELPLPVLVPLSSFAEHRRQFAKHEDPRQRQLATFVSLHLMERQAGLNLPNDFFSTLLDQGRHVILLLDGLDEVANEDERALVSQAVRDLSLGREHARFVVTSRTRAYEGHAVLADFRVVHVLRLEPEPVADLIRHAYSAIYPTLEEADDRRRHAAELIADVEQLEAERAARLGGSEESRLVTTPLMVRMLLIVHFNLRRLPDQRAELYQEVVDTLLTSAHNPDEAVAQRLAALGGDWRLRRDMCQHLANRMHSRGKEAGRDIYEPEMTVLLQDYLVKRGRKTPAQAEELVVDFIAVSRQRGGLLDERAGYHRFTHLSFQEYLMARYLAEVKREVERIAEFLEAEGRVADSWWRETILLTVGYLNMTAPDVAVDLVHRLAHLDEPVAPSTPLALAAAELAGTGFLEWGGAETTGQALALRLKDLLTDPDLQGAEAPLRASAGRVLSRLGDPREGVGVIAVGPTGPTLPAVAWCHVAGGPFLIGANPGEPADTDEAQHELTLPEFHITRYAITNAQFAPFVAGDGYSNRRWWTSAGWKWRSQEKRTRPGYWDDAQFNQLNQPVVGVTWYEAVAYCTWLEAQARDLGQQVAPSEDPDGVLRLVSQDGWRLRLPTEAEWEKAAGWDPVTGHKRVYTWGDEWAPDNANVEAQIERTSAVGVFPAGQSPCGALDMTGNVWEWTSSLYREYPYSPNDGREDPMADGTRALRGGSWGSDRRTARVSARSHGAHPDGFNHLLGFRVVVAPISS